MINRFRVWLKTKFCTHQYKEASVVGITEDSSSGFTVYHEIYSLQCIRCEELAFVRSKEDADYILKESDDYHSSCQVQ